MGLFSSKQVSTQQHLDIEDIRDNMVVLRNGKVSVVLETTSLNFELLANQEQDVRIYTFAGLLNSLKFPIQIVIRTQHKDVSKYQELLTNYKNRVGSNAVKQQLTIYQDFVSNLTSTSRILDKRFYAIVPTLVGITQQTGSLRQMFGKPPEVVNVERALKKAKLELQPKVAHLIKQFGNMGLVARQLTNDELIKLYYSIYEPDRKGMEVLNLREDEITSALVGYGESPPPKPDSSTKTAKNPFDENLKQAQVTQQVQMRQKK